MIRKCTCKSKFQDKRYGKKNRVYTFSGVLKVGKRRCTVCGRERDQNNMV